MGYLDGNGAYKIRSHTQPDRRPDSGRQTRQSPETRRHITPNKEMRLNKVDRSRHTASSKPIGVSFTSISLRTWRKIVAGGLFVAIIAVFLMAAMNCQLRKNETVQQINECRKELQNLVNDYNGIKVKYDSRMNDTAIEVYARTHLGMQHRENYQVTWIEIDGDDEFDID